MLRIRYVLACAASACVLASASADAAALTVVNTNFPTVNCTYKTTCSVTPTDTSGNFTPPQDVGTGFLQSRTIVGTAPAPAGGKLGYWYRVDMTGLSDPVASNCVTKMAINFGTVVQEPYSGGALKDMFVATSGGSGTIGVASASQTGSVVTIVFAGSGVCPHQSSFFFGLTSATTTPVVSVAQLFYSLGGSAFVDARIP
jgi:hypothetical protein